MNKSIVTEWHYYLESPKERGNYLIIDDNNYVTTMHYDELWAFPEHVIWWAEIPNRRKMWEQYKEINQFGVE